MGKFTDILEGAVNVDIDLANGGYDYFGFIRKNGEWIIMRSTATSAEESRFKLGASGYSAAFAARTSQNYTLPLKG